MLLVSCGEAVLLDRPECEGNSVGIFFWGLESPLTPRVLQRDNLSESGDLRKPVLSDMV